MKLTLLFLCCFYFTNYTFGQEQDYTIEYYPQTQKARGLEQNDELDKSFQLYKSLFQEYRPIFNDLISGIRVAINLNQYEVAKLWLIKAFKRGATFEQLSRNGIKFKAIKQLPEWDSLKVQLIALRSKYLNSVDYTLREELKQMQQKDQLYRKNSRLFKKNIAKQNALDQVNFKRLKELIEAHNGWITDEKYGNNSVSKDYIDPYIITLHLTKNEDKQYFDQILTRAHKNGKIDPFKYGHFKYYVMGEKSIDLVN